jgi:multidrug transporter EmrE-like cation transporter
VGSTLPSASQQACTASLCRLSTAVVLSLMMHIPACDTGLSVSQALWSGLSLVISFLWGVAVFHEHVPNLPLAALGAFLPSMLPPCNADWLRRLHLARQPCVECLDRSQLDCLDRSRFEDPGRQRGPGWLLPHAPHPSSLRSLFLAQLCA